MSEKAPQTIPNTRDGEVSYDENVKRFRIKSEDRSGAPFFAEDKILEHYGYGDDARQETPTTSTANTPTNAEVNPVDNSDPNPSATSWEAPDAATAAPQVSADILRQHGYSDRATEESRLSAAEARKALHDEASGVTPRPAKPRSSGNSFAAFEADAVDGIKQTQDDRYNAMGEDHMGLRLSKELSAEKATVLNDQAQIEIWGSEGREVTVDGVTYTADNPYPGRLATMLSETAKSPKARQELTEKANKYEADILALVDNGYELTQAKLIMDLRDQDVASKEHMIKERIKTGISREEAAAQADEVYAKKSAKREQLIKDMAILDEGEYEKAISSGPEDTVDPLPEPPKKPEETPEVDPKAERLVADLDSARTKYAELLAESSTTMSAHELRDKFGKERESANSEWKQAIRAIVDYRLKQAAQASEGILSQMSPEERERQIELARQEISSQEVVLQHFYLEKEKFGFTEKLSEEGPKGLLKIWRSGGLFKKVKNKLLNKAGIVTKIGAGVGIGYGAGALLGANPATSMVTGAASFGLRSHAKRFDKLTDRAHLDAERSYNSLAEQEVVSIDELGDEIESRNRTRRTNNAARMAGSVLLGAGAGYGVSTVLDKLSGGGEATPDPTAPEAPAPEAPAPQAPEVPAPQTPVAEVPVPTPETLPFTDGWTQGEGITHTLGDLISDRLPGVTASPDQLWQLYQMNEAALDQIAGVGQMAVQGGDGFVNTVGETTLSADLVEKLLSDFRSLG